MSVLTGNFLALAKTLGEPVFEGTNKYKNPYTVVFGGKELPLSLKMHPYETGEWKGEIYKRKLTTAAGRYQITVTTWRLYGMKGKSFSPEEQDNFFVNKILGEKRGIKMNIEQGYFTPEVRNKLAEEWTSLPGGVHNGDNMQWDDFFKLFVKNGGAYWNKNHELIGNEITISAIREKKKRSQYWWIIVIVSTVLTVVGYYLWEKRKK